MSLLSSRWSCPSVSATATDAPETPPTSPRNTMCSGANAIDQNRADAQLDVSRDSQQRPFRGGALALLALVALVVFAVASMRFVARDEGFYLYAARLITEGQIPYRDFFLPQMPFMPYLYAGWFSVMGVSWTSARVMAALIAMGCAVFVYLCARHIYGERSARVSLLLFGLCAGIQVWLPLAKNAGVACLCLLMALYFSLVRGKHVFAGLCMGLALLSRLTFAPLLVLLLIPRSRSEWLGQVGKVCLGLVPAALVLAWLYWLAPENFIVNNLTYHLQRTRLDEDGIADNKRHIFMGLIGLKYCVGGGGRQFMLLLVATLASFWCAPRRRFEHTILVSSAALYCILHFIPSPTYVQYFFVVLVLAVAPAAHVLVSAADRILKRFAAPRIAAFSLAFAIVAFGWLGSLDFYRYLVNGERVIGVGRLFSESWRIQVPSVIAKAIDTANTARKPVYVSWPGYLLESESKALPGTENNFGVGWANNQGVRGRHAAERRVLGRDGILKAYDSGIIDRVVLFVGRGVHNTLGDTLVEKGARRAVIYPGIDLYERPEPAALLNAK